MHKSLNANSAAISGCGALRIEASRRARKPCLFCKAAASHGLFAAKQQTRSQHYQQGCPDRNIRCPPIVKSASVDPPDGSIIA